MARFDHTTKPEKREWARALLDSPAAQEAPLLRLAERMEREGDAEDRLDALSNLLHHYARHGEREQALGIVDRIAALSPQAPEVSLWYDLASARALIYQLGDYERAEPLVERALRDLSSETDVAQRRHWGAWLKSLELAIHVGRSAPLDVAEATLKELTDFLGSGFPHPETLPTIAALVEAGGNANLLVGLLQTMWADLARQYRFHACGDPKDLREIERLLALLDVPVMRDL
ncbi:MAG: hypothetical protein ACO1SX_00590 [Actinomycetota bacterium]